MKVARSFRSCLVLPLLLLSRPALPEEKQSAVEVTRDNVWEAHIGISKSLPIWKKGSDHIEISPTLTNGATYVPQNLLDAWRELDHMLPRNYVQYRLMHFTASVCQDDAEVQSLQLDDSIMYYINAKWIKFGKSQLFDEIISREKVTFTGLEAVDVDALKDKLSNPMSGYLLCGYYTLKQTGNTKKPFQIMQKFSVYANNQIAAFKAKKDTTH